MAPEYTAPGVYIEETKFNAVPIPGVPTSIAAFIGRTENGPADVAVRCLSLTEFNDVFGAGHPASEIARSVRAFFANGGKECYVVRSALPDLSGLHALDAIPIFNLLIIPRDADISDAVQRDIAATASRYCQTRRALLLLDASRALATSKDPSADTAELATAVVAENVAIFCPDVLYVADGGTSMGPSGAVAGVMARLDATRGIWKAAAGAEAAIAGDPPLAVQFSSTVADSMVQAGVNSLRVLNGHTIVWGARTLAARSGGTDWKYVPVRRLALYLEASIEQALKRAVFEHNDQTLWTAVRGSVEDFMRDIWRSGALMGAKQQEAFFVKCGTDTMTQDDIDNGRLIVMIGFAPARPAEFVIFRIGQNVAGPELGASLQGAGAVASSDPVARRGAAEALAGRLALPLHRIDLGAVVSKYIGETEKNLERIFERAERSAAVLFFDEADALFGKRTEVKDAHDRFAGIDIAGLLHRIRKCKSPVLLGLRSADKPHADVASLGHVVDLDAHPHIARRVRDT